MNKNDWTLIYKRSPDEGFSHVLCETNILYTPYSNPDNTILCMHWDHLSEYQNYQNRPDYTEELVDFWFNKEVDNLTRFQDKSYCPEVYYINMKERKVYIEWPGESCNAIVFDSSRDIDSECPDWKEQIQDIVLDIFKEGYYKCSLYPHCFYIKNGTIKTFDWYATFPTNNFFLDYDKFIKGMAGTNSNFRFVESMENGEVNFQNFFMQGIKQHIKWPTVNPLHSVYEIIK